MRPRSAAPGAVGPRQMISREQAHDILRTLPLSTPGTEEVPLAEARQRVLARPVRSPLPIPPFDRSAMDGFALPPGDDSTTFTVAMTLAAGDVPQASLASGECARIMTGAMLPVGADRVVRREYVSEEDGRITLERREDGANVMRCGEDVRPGDEVLPAGCLLRPAEIGLLASLGLDRVTVARRPRVGVMATGNELVEPGLPLPRGRIYNANTHSLLAQLASCGLAPRLLPAVADEPDPLAAAIDELGDCDVVILSGGVSAGDFDFVPAALRRHGVRIRFEKVAVQPGMPTVFGQRGDRFFFGLPGNPVSTLVIFEVFVKPFLFRLAGHDWQPAMRSGTMRAEYRRKRAERTLFLPVRVIDRLVDPLDYHGSGHLHALSRADGLLEIAAGVSMVAAGESVDVRPI